LGENSKIYRRKDYLIVCQEELTDGVLKISNISERAHSRQTLKIVMVTIPEKTNFENRVSGCNPAGGRMMKLTAVGSNGWL